MTLRLPETLPYDAVDEYIDANFAFNSGVFIDDDDVPMTRFYAGRRGTNEGDYVYRGNISRPLISLIEDTRSMAQEDDEGYVTWHYASSDAMVWTAEELSETEIDLILDNL